MNSEIINGSPRKVARFLTPADKVISGARPFSGATPAYLKALRAAELTAWEEPGFWPGDRANPPTLGQLTADFESGIAWETWLAGLLLLCVCAALLQFSLGMFDFFGKWSTFVARF